MRLGYTAAASHSRLGVSTQKRRRVTKTNAAETHQQKPEEGEEERRGGEEGRGEEERPLCIQTTSGS